MYEFFSEVKLIVNQNEKLRAKKKANGEFFNIFSILGMERDEVHTHSSFLAELLNPKGTHGENDYFLKLFVKNMPLDRINVKNKRLLKYESAIVKKEEYIGKKDVKNETGGDIDILIEFSNPQYAIIIENKIDAGDQEAQLARYRNYAEKYKNNFTLFYLTKSGYEPSEWSTGKKTEEHYWTCISYSKDIKRWLEACLEKLYGKPSVKETIRQYIELINNLTGQELNKKMADDISKIMLKHNEEMLAFWQAKEEWQYKFFEQAMRKVAEETNCDFEAECQNTPCWIWNAKYYVKFTPKTKKLKSYTIWFGKSGRDKPYYFLAKDGISKSQNKLQCMTGKASGSEPFGYNYIADKYKNWDLNVACDIQNGEFGKYITDCINRILDDPNFPK